LGYPLLDLEGIPTPGRSTGGKAWSRTWLRKIVENDLYKPHTVAALRALGVSETVLATLDADKVYGVYRFEGIPVPIPDASIPLEVVDAARYIVRNHRSPARSGNRFWELSGGILYCAECKRKMQPMNMPRKSTTYHYYRCQGITNGKADRCGMRKHIRAEVIEKEVWEAVSHLTNDKEYVLRKMRDHFAQRRKELSRVGANAGTLAKKLEKIETSWVNYQKAYAGGGLSLADLKARRAELDNERDALQRELERIMHREEELEKLDIAERETQERIEATADNLEDITPEKRHELYQDLRLRVEVGEDKRPYISGIFPLGRTENGTHTLYVSRLDTSPTWGGPGTTSASRC
jgi:hypothetical protein